MSKTRDSVVSALTYPAFVLVVAVLVVAIIMGYAVPTFAAAPPSGLSQTAGTSAQGSSR